MSIVRTIYRFFWVRYRGCWRKVAHTTEARAAREAARLRSGAHAYRCPHCRKWHVGHSYSRWR
jgi:hypothetical protein